MSLHEAVQAFQLAESGFGERMQARGVLFDPALGVEAGLLAALPHLLPSERGWVVYVCSNQKCAAVYASDPMGHCPKCVQANGVGWSTARSDVL